MVDCKKILIVTAMEDELAPLLLDVEQVKTNFINKVYKKKKGKNEIFLTNIGIGKVNASFSITSLIYEVNPDLIVNFGTAGGVNKSLKILDLVLADKTAYHDVDVTGFGYNIGQVPGHDVYYENFINDEIVKELKKVYSNIKQGLIVSGDQFIGLKEAGISLETNFPDVLAVDMESCAVVDVCQKLNKEVLVIRGISDLAHEQSHLEFDKYIIEVMKQFRGIICLLEG